MFTNSQNIPFELSTLAKVMRASAVGGALSGSFGSITDSIVFSPLVGGGFGTFSTTIFTALIDGIQDGENVKPNVANEAKIYGGTLGGAIGGVVGFATNSPSIGAFTGALVGGTIGGAYYTGISFFGKKNVDAIATPEISQSKIKAICYNWLS